MKIVSGLRSCDMFGASQGFNIGGQSQTTTLGGGLVTLGLRVLILFYFCSRFAVVINKRGPTISSYSIGENRSSMQVPLNLGDMNLRFYWGFLAPNLAPI